MSREMIFYALLFGFLLDLLIGDPHFLYHPVCMIGWVIRKMETIIRRFFGKDQRSLLMGGVFLTLTVLLITGTVAYGLLFFAGLISEKLEFFLASVFCWQILAVKSLRTESMKVYEKLKENDVEGARYAVSMIVGRDTERLSEQGIIKAAVETVAENTSDGVIAPFFYMAVGGPVLGFLYKAVNTMDSMIGYRDDRYLYLGRAAAKLDDAVNFIPARLSAGLMIAASLILGYDWKNAARIFRRDRFCHASPNSAQTESVCAGALDVVLAGDAWYRGVLHKKDTIGDPIREIEVEDIRRSCRLLYGTAFLAMFLTAGIYLCFLI